MGELLDERVARPGVVGHGEGGVVGEEVGEEEEPGLELPGEELEVPGAAQRRRDLRMRT